MKNIVLIGYRCTGKTSVGRKLAARLGMAFYDTDALVQEENERTIRQIVDMEGWAAFRAEEKKIISRLALQEKCVFALGGGAVMDPGNIEVMKCHGRLIWLLADLPTILQRMGQDDRSGAQRPPLQGRDSAEEVALILEARTPVYEAAADITVDTREKTIEEIVEEIVTYFT